MDANGFDIQIDAGNSISFDGATAASTIIGDGDGQTFTIPSEDNFDFVVTGTGSVFNIDSAFATIPNAYEIRWLNTNRAIGNDPNGFIFKVETGDDFSFKVDIKYPLF